jgi:hypothetical protein
LDSFVFLQSINYFSISEDKKYLIFKNIIDKFKNDTIFYQIKEIFEYINRQNTLNTTKPKFTINKTKNSYNNINGTESNKENQIKENKYSLLVEELFNKRDEEEKKEKEFITKCNKTYYFYAREELIDYFNEINTDSNIKNALSFEKGEFFINLSNYEENIFNYFNSEFKNKTNYTVIENKEFEMRYRNESNGVTLMFEKEVEINIIHFLSLLYECEYYPKWLPFNSIAKCIFQPGKAKKLVYLMNNMILYKREFIIYGFGINLLKTEKKIFLLCQSIDEENNLFRDYTRKVESKCTKGEIKIFGYEMKIISKNKISVKALINVNPKIGIIPQSLINFLSQKV